MRFSFLQFNKIVQKSFQELTFWRRSHLNGIVFVDEKAEFGSFLRFMYEE
jgi:hypothetical protein